ncbi:HlyD family efflux transporter periplasmic adaptor subunit [Flavobacteriaceae bacterium TP-CH-4]|uniref:HlyD family efflux transporter periplasmic adaptor subunit n=1 Tax=Pelagihabitans pacificus TaxID=2696054 RepID=A0A967AUF8_9FLAO|nr:HlyD family efflux transporter periplasmic adaptor subunit [Pelagihabitans pacificus]NHF59570.1 HlyD family efflux transporter periplasmic adaptor subunit [Pelagihabitans pacificus]
MKKNGYKTLFWSLSIVLTTSCSNNEKSDAYGNFEAVSVTIGAEGIGRLVSFGIEEGEQLKAGAQVGLIDTTQLHLEKLQLQAKLEAMDLKLQEAAPDIAILLEQKQNAVRERDRTKVLYEQKAATKKQLDDFNGEIDVIDQQINSTKRRIGVANRGILSERKPIQAQIDIIEKRIQDHRITNPIDGTVLTKIVEESEFVNTGAPLYKIANLSTLKLRAYTSASLLQNVKLGDTVTVLVDDAANGYRTLEGRVMYIASEAEFTPKTIETKEERVNLVYAINVEVQNDGSLKIGMPGEVQFKHTSK